jgi:hypothetical protein
LLKATRADPNVIIQMEIPLDDALDRYHKQKLDPITGKEYNIGMQLIDVEIKERLVTSGQSTGEYVRNGFQMWNENLVHLEDYFGE